MAAQKGHMAVVKVLLHAGADKTRKFKGTTTPARIASSKGHRGVSKFIEKFKYGEENHTESCSIS